LEKEYLELLNKFLVKFVYILAHRESISNIVPIKPTGFLLRVSVLGGIKGFLSVELYVL